MVSTWTDIGVTDGERSMGQLGEEDRLGMVSSWTDIGVTGGERLMGLYKSQPGQQLESQLVRDQLAN